MELAAKEMNLTGEARRRVYLHQFLLPRTITENTLRHGFAPGPEGE